MVEFSITKIISLTFSLLILIFGLLIKRINGEKYTPSTFYSFFWFFITFLPQLILFNVPISPIPIFYIFISSVLFSVPSLFFNWSIASKSLIKNNISTINSLKSNFFKKIFFVTFFCSIYFLFLMLKQNGLNLTSFLLDFLGASTQFANNRTLYDYQYGIIGQLTTLFPFVVVIMGSFIIFFSKKKRSKIFIFLLSMFPVTLSMLLQSSKVLMLYGLLFYISTYIFLKIYTNDNNFINKNNFKKVIYFAVLFSPILFIAFRSRQGYEEIGIFEIGPLLFSYLFGSIYAFSDYFLWRLDFNSLGSYIEENALQYGYYSFKPLFEFFGGTKVFPMGYYEDFYNFEYFIQTNIFTYFRQLIQDFGISGSLLFIFIMGIIIHFFYYLLHRTRTPFASITIFIMFLGFLGMSYLINPFTSRTLLAVGFIIYIIFNLNMVKFNYKSIK